MIGNAIVPASIDVIWSLFGRLTVSACTPVVRTAEATSHCRTNMCVQSVSAYAVDVLARKEDGILEKSGELITAAASVSNLNRWPGCHVRHVDPPSTAVCVAAVK